MRILIPYFQPYWKIGAITLLLITVSKIAAVIGPYFFKKIVDAVQVKDADFLNPLLLILGYGLVRVMTTACHELGFTVISKPVFLVARRVGKKILLQILQLPHAFHLSSSLGSISRDIHRGISSLTLIIFPAFFVIPAVIELLLISAFLIWQYDISFLIVILLTVLVYMYFTLKTAAWRIKFHHAANQADSSIAGKITDTLNNFESVKQFTKEEFEAQDFGKYLRKWQYATLKNYKYAHIVTILQSLIVATGVMAILFISVNQAHAGLVTVGDLILINFYLIQLITPLQFLAFTYREIKQYSSDINKMLTLAGVCNAQEVGQGVSFPDNSSCLVEFKNVSFAYEGSKDTLSNINFSVKKGQKVAIVGVSGGGKSTIGKLLLRLYENYDGNIEINNVEIREINLKILRKNIAVIPQDTTLFNQSIYYNIAYGSDKNVSQAIIDSAKKAKLFDFITSLPEKFATKVGERGLRLSGGEKQRLSIARAILKNAPILLLDEATSSLDTVSEQALQLEFNAISEDRTTIVIAHRLYTIKDADEILVLEKGKIIERGTHEELMSSKGHYYLLWQSQLNQGQSFTT